MTMPDMYYKYINQNVKQSIEHTDIIDKCIISQSVTLQITTFRQHKLVTICRHNYQPDIIM